MTLLQLEQIGLIYGEGETALEALTGINLVLRPGELTLLLGPSGSGKTSLLQIMGCLQRPTHGRVRLMGEEVSDLPPEHLARLRLHHFGFIFQAYNLFPTLRAWENVAIALDLKGVPKREHQPKALTLLARLGLENRAHAFPAELSGGQKQRVAIARALAGAPTLLLADEPTAALDGKTGQAVAAQLQALAHSDGCAVVVVSHDPRMLPYADRILTLEDGQITGDHGQDAVKQHSLSLETLLTQSHSS